MSERFVVTHEYVTEMEVEVAAVDRFLVIVNNRLRAELPLLQPGALKDALTQLPDLDTTGGFTARANTIFKNSDMSTLHKDHRYAIHMLAALKGLLEIRESFQRPVQSNQQDYRAIKSLNPRGESVVCWVMLRGSNNNDRRVSLAQGLYVCLAMALCEAQRGGLLQTKNVKKEKAAENEETSHRCHQALCIKPGHLCGETQKTNFSRMDCGALTTCHHKPQCLLPHRDTRKAQYQFVVDMIAEHKAGSTHRSKMHPKKKQRMA